MTRSSLLTFAHEVVRDTAFADPLMLLWAAHKADATARFANILRRCIADDGASADSVDAAALGVRVVGDGPLYVALFTMPRPAAVAECFFVGVAVVIPDDLLAAAPADAPGRDALERALATLMSASTLEQRQAVHVPMRMFMLEYAVDVDGAAGAALCEWHNDGIVFRRTAHGVAVDVDADAFVDAIATACVAPTAQA
jgi:hypothetical protein